MIKVGLTGGIGSGKSTVARIFQILGTDVYSADIEAKRLMQTNVSLKNKIIDLLGEQSYLEGILNTNYISSRVFNDTVLLGELNALVHPVVREDFFMWLQERKDQPYAIQESALLFESEFSTFFDYTVLVTCDLETRVNRIVERDNKSKSDVLARIAQQKPDEEKLKLSDFQIYNQGDELLIPQVIELHNKFVSLHRK
ncbi:MAG: dephospho-CoA kinase [Bacteroidales bacterium]|nr:dephospho-CoA kinase [Bacteroidales bacterium]